MNISADQFPSDRSDHLIAVIRQLCFAPDLHTVTTLVRSAARQLTGADGITFVLRVGEECHYVDEDAIEAVRKERRAPLNACVAGWVILNGATVVIPNVDTDRRVLEDAYRPTFVKSLVMVPVRAQEPMAAIGAYWAHEHAATASELATFWRTALLSRCPTFGFLRASERPWRMSRPLAWRLRQPPRRRTNSLRRWLTSFGNPFMRPWRRFA